MYFGVIKSRAMKKIVVSLAAIFAAIITLSAQTTVPGGSVSGTWTAAGSPYRVEGDISVDYGDSLVIEPGVVVDFEGHHRMYVDGVLHAVGAPGDSIRFTRVTNDLSMLPDSAELADTSNYNGSWGGMEFSIGSGFACNLSYCIIEFISTVDNTATSESSLLSPVDFQGNGRYYLDRSAIRNNYGTHCGGIRAEEYLYMDSCTLRDNRAFGVNNTSISSAGGLLLQYSDRAEITNNVFKFNKVYGHSAGAAMKVYASSVLIMNNFITNNRSYRENTVSAGGILCISAYPRIIQNLIVNNESGSAGGIYYQWGGGKLYCNTICYNKSPRWDGAGVFFEGASGVIATDNILYGNTYQSGLSQIYLSSISSQPVVRYNLIGSDIGEVRGSDNGAIKEADNFFGDPSFENATGVDGVGPISVPGDWMLSVSSFLLNKGLVDPVNEFSIERDMAGNNRVNYGHVDPGCFEYRLASYTPAATVSSPEIWIADTVYITQETTLNAKVSIYPGVVVCSDGNHNIYAYDSLYAIGTAEAPIFFTMKDTAGFHDAGSSDGGWGHIRVQGSKPRIFRHCIFEFGKVYRIVDEERGLITGEVNGNVHVDNCTFRNCYMIHASLVYTFSGSNYTVTNCTFYNNKITSTAGVVMLAGSNFTVNGNLIFNNDCEQRIVSLNGANIELVNNSIYHNNGNVSIGTCFNITIANNTIVKNSAGVSMWTGDNARIVNSIIPDLSMSQEGYRIISSFVPSYICNGKCTDLMIDEPVFKNPLDFEGPGDPEQVMLADYSLTDISPGIDFGTRDTAGLHIGLLDVSGNPRINNGRVDVGAYENQGNLPVVTGQPAGGIFCTGDNHVLEVTREGSDTVEYKWFKDGAYMAGQDQDRTLELDSLTTASEGNYHCRVSNAYGNVLSASVYIKVNSPPVILVQPRDAWHQAGKPVSLAVTYTGSSPVNFQWKKDGGIMPGAILPEYRFTPVDSSMEGSYVCTVSNMCGTLDTDPAALYLAPQICMVTVDRETGNNLVVWEKKSRAPILAYNVYRESEAAGIYDLLETVPYDKLSVYEDSVADPTVQAYLYKITALDTAENETDIDLCKPHKTIHLLVTTNPELNTTQLAWDKYYGFEYQTYTIYRSQTKSDFDSIHSLSASLNSWTDPDPLDSDLFYRISVRKPVPCEPEGLGKKAGTGPYSHSLSNMDDNKLKLGSLPPDTITLSNHSVDEEQSPGTVIGKFITEDPDTADAHYYQFIAGTGGEDNLNFTLVGDLLLASESFDYETKNQYSIRVRSTDLAGNYCEVPFTIQVIDIDETTGIPVNRAGTLEVYPNPFSHSATVRFPNPGGESCRMVLRDLSGKVCRIMEGITGTEFILEKGGLKNGLYFIEMNGPKTFRGKIVIE